VVVADATLVPAQLFVQFFAAGFKSGIDIMGMALGLRIQAGGQMNSRFAVQFVPGTRKDHGRVSRTLGVFLDDLADFGLYVGLKRVTYVNLSAADLIPHIVSCIDGAVSAKDADPAAVLGG
jgi:hypothetical protein